MRRIYLDHAATMLTRPQMVKGKSIEEALKISNKTAIEDYLNNSKKKGRG
jgi:NifU-like protein involved in Fe-S cluster formation